jgi:hypothetical protein
MMSWVQLSDTKPVAKTQHRCIWCGETIEIGEKHANWSGLMDGKFQSNRGHLECMDAIDEFFSDGCEECFDPFENERPERKTVKP